ncbi:MAG: hypothetical protein M1338_03770 [Patescibacteria group bacterium]|nr:hypothetical protein [Patescibacteria group bacterium]
MRKNNSSNNSGAKPLTLEVLAKYNKNILLPEMRECFVDKKGFNEFKNKSFTNQDKTLKKLDILLTEKTVGKFQKQKEQKMWLIIIKALKNHKILSDSELEKINHLNVF